MSDKGTTYVSKSGEISAEEIAKAQAMYATARQEGEDKHQMDMPATTHKSVTGTIELKEVREAMSKAEDEKNDSAPIG